MCTYYKVGGIHDAVNRARIPRILRKNMPAGIVLFVRDILWDLISLFRLGDSLQEE
jgi:hypothetical protein